MALALLTLIALLPLAGCKKKGPDLKGMDIIIGNWWADYDASTAKANSDNEERQIAYRLKIQKDNGFKIREKNIASWDELPQVAITSIMAGSPAAQVMLLPPNLVLSLYNQKLLYPVNEVTTVDLTSTKPIEWNRQIIEAFTFDGKSYGFYIGYGGSAHATGVYFNKRLFAEAGLDPELPYNMQKDGSWTWENFLDLSKKLTRDINNDGIMDTYAMTADISTTMLLSAAASNNAHFIDKDAAGKFVNAAGRPDFLQALQFTVRLQREGVLMPRPENSAWNWYKPAFHDGKVAMMVEAEYVRNEIEDMADDWGWVFYPKGPNANDYLSPTDENVMVIPVTYSPEEVDKIMYAVQLWNMPIDDDPDSWKDAMYYRYRDARAVDDTLAMTRMPDHGVMNYHAFIPGLEIGDIAWNMWWWEGDPAQLVESVSASWNGLLDDANGIK
jgi:ABC-type glycerol-3-phosphate transport system substrate-binding protein